MHDYEKLMRAAESAENPELIQNTLNTLFKQIETLKERLEQVSKTPENGEVVKEKLAELTELRHGMDELTERMQREYIISPELHTIIGALDTLAEAGDLNALILEGEPGTGKTQLAYSLVGKELQEGRNSCLIHIRVKETTVAQDLLYTVDDVRRLSDSQAKSIMPEPIRKQAADWKRKILQGEIGVRDEGYREFRETMDEVMVLGEGTKDLDYRNYIDLGPLGEAVVQSAKGKKVWLVFDEIEKGREELMTGLLDEIEHLQFSIPEIGRELVGVKENLRIIVTTNPEDSDKIPDAFRRRCLYHYMQYPRAKEMGNIVALRFPGMNQRLLDYALSVFYAYHNHENIEKKPSTPELISWIGLLLKEYKDEVPENLLNGTIEPPFLTTLLKHKDDLSLRVSIENLKVREEVELRKDELPLFVDRAFTSEHVYKLHDNFSLYSEQENLQSFYAKLDSAGVSYVTPTFEEYEEYEDGEYITKHNTVDFFRIVSPGFECLGGEYYNIPEDYIRLFADKLSQQAKAVEEDCDFERVEKSTADFVFGYVNIDGQTRQAYKVKKGDGAGKFVVLEEIRNESM